MSFAPEVKTGGDDKWYGNALRFATELEASQNVTDLMSRWTAVREVRVVESSDPVNYRWDPSEGLIPIGRASEGVVAP